MQNATQMTEEFQRKKLEELLSQCTEDERETFGRCFPKGVPADSLIGALNLVIRTINASNGTTTAVVKKGIYKFHWDCGRMGDLDGVFIATSKEVADRIGKEIYFGEVLGKHSEISGTLEEGEVQLITDEPTVVRLFEDFDLAAGHNPLKVMCGRDEDGEWMDS